MIKINLKIKSLDKITINLYINYIIKIFLKLSCKINYITSFPIKTKRITLLKSPHVHKKAMEQFEMKIFTKVISFNIKNIKNIIPFLYINKPKNIKISLSYLLTND